MKIINVLKKYKILIGAIIILVIIGIIALKTNFPKKLLNYINKDLIEQTEQIKKEKEELREEMIQDSINFVNELNQKAIEVEAFKFKYNNSLKTIRKYENALNNYRVGDFSPNFSKFTGNVTSTDTLSIEGFNTDN